MFSTHNLRVRTLELGKYIGRSNPATHGTWVRGAEDPNARDPLILREGPDPTPRQDPLQSISKFPPDVDPPKGRLKNKCKINMISIWLIMARYTDCTDFHEIASGCGGVHMCIMYRL